MSAPRPRFTFDPVSHRYRDRRGRFVPNETIHRWLVEATTTGGGDVRGLTQRLRDGQIAIRDWQLAMTQAVKDAHLAAAMAAKGGRAQMTQSDWGRAGRILRDEYGFLDRFARGMADGSIPMDGRILARAEQYALAGRQTYADFQRREMQRRGLTEERRILAPVEHCPECVEYAGRGWVAIGTLPAPGDASSCRARCRCSFEFR